MDMNPPLFSVKIEIPGDPKGMGRAKSRHIKAKDGREFDVHYTPEASRIEAGVIRMYAEKAMAGRAPVSTAVVLHVAAYLPVPKSFTKKMREGALAQMPTVWPVTKPDGDNIVKFIDQLKSVVWCDDKQVVDTHIYKRYTDRPRLVMQIREKTVL
jgi:Holliday junction resolvase RusA-like endonuclease